MTEYKIEMSFEGLPSTEFMTEILGLLREHEQKPLNKIKVNKITIIKVTE